MFEGYQRVNIYTHGGENDRYKLQGHHPCTFFSSLLRPVFVIYIIDWPAFRMEQVQYYLLCEQNCASVYFSLAIALKLHF